MSILKTGRNLLGQSTLIPKPTLTERNLPDQAGKVFIVTGANTGIGKDLSQILYSKNATVYAASRDVSKCEKAVSDIREAHKESEGRIEILKLDLADLSAIKASAEEFLSKEKRLDVLWNNAGVLLPPHGSKTPTGHELQMGTNCIGHYALTELLKPILQQTAATAPPNSVRVTWAGSIAIDGYSPKGGVRFNEDGGVIVESNPTSNYSVSKVGNLFLAQQFAKEVEGKGIVSVCFNPGNIRTELYRHFVGSWIGKVLSLPLYVGMYPSIMGAYTELYAGLSQDLTTADNGSYIAPWGRKSFNRPDVEAGMKSEAEGGSGGSDKFVEYIRRETRAYL